MTYSIYNNLTNNWEYVGLIWKDMLRKLVGQETEIACSGKEPYSYYTAVWAGDGHKTTFVKHTQIRKYRVFDSEGRVIHRDVIIQGLQSRRPGRGWYSLYWSRLHKYRMEAVPFTGHSGRNSSKAYYRYHTALHPKELLEPLLRKKYLQEKKWMLDNWDGDARCTEKNWKSQRRTQYK